MLDKAQKKAYLYAVLAKKTIQTHRGVEQPGSSSGS